MYFFRSALILSSTFRHAAYPYSPRLSFGHLLWQAVNLSAHPAQGGFSLVAESILFIACLHPGRNVHQVRTLFFCPGQATKIPDGGNQMILILPPIHILDDVSHCAISKAVARDSLFLVSVAVFQASVFVMLCKPHQHAHWQKVKSPFPFVHIANGTGRKRSSFATIFDCHSFSSPVISSL